MQENMYNTATSIANIFLAAKIYKTLNKYIARKESLIIDDDLISLEDYLFGDYNFNKANTDTLNNLIVIDYAGNILNFANNYCITESELVNFKNGSNMTARIDFKINIHDTKEVTNVVAGIPQVIEISGQATSNDITIKEGDRPNEVNVYDTKSGNLIARIKLIISEKIKPLIQTILERVKKIFSNDTIRRPLAYIIGLISSFVIMPIYSKIKNLFKPKQENYLYFEAEDELNSRDQEKANPEDQEKVNKLANKIVTLISKFFKGTSKILKAFVQFLVALLKNIKLIAISLLLFILRLFQAFRVLFIIFLTVVASIFTASISVKGKGLEKIGELTNLKPVVNFAEKLKELAENMTERLVGFTIKHGALKPAISQLKLLYKEAQMALDHNINALEQLMNKENIGNVKPKLVKLLNNVIDNGVIKTLKQSVLIAIKTGVLVVDESFLADYKKICDLINNYISYLKNLLQTKKFINQLVGQDIVHDRVNKTIEELISAIDNTIKQLEASEDEVDTYTEVIALFNIMKRNLIDLRIA